MISRDLVQKENMIPFHHQVSSHLSSEGAEVDHFQLLFHNSAELIHEISVDRHGIGDVVIGFFCLVFHGFLLFYFVFVHRPLCPTDSCFLIYSEGSRSSLRLW